MGKHTRNSIADVRLTRRAAMMRMAAGAAGVLGASRTLLAGEAVSTRPAARIESLPGGGELIQITHEEFRQSNFYCEIPYCSADSRYFVYERRNRKLPTPNRMELMVVELGTWKQHRLDVAGSTAGLAITREGVLYYTQETGSGGLDLVQADISKGVPERVFSFGRNQRPASFGTVSPDGRYYAAGQWLDPQYERFGILLVDLKKGETLVIDEDPCIFNPHPQFEPAEGRHLMIQYNRGGKFSPDRKKMRLIGPEGATLYLLSVPEGKRTPLQIGTPFTSMITGHEVWIAKTKEILLSLVPEGDYTPERGLLVAIREGQQARVVAKGYRYNHVNVSRCGRYFCCDDWQGNWKIVLGSMRTGKTLELCEARTSRSKDPDIHPHAYLTPDLKWVIFDSDRSGSPHVYAASVTSEMLQHVDEAYERL